MMRSLGLFLAAASVSFVAAEAGGHSTRRNVILNGQIADSYDFVIVGGGTAGLVLASRLSEDANTTVLVLEAGDTGDGIESINAPADAYYDSLLDSSYDWAYSTVPQPKANNRVMSWSRGKVLGGSSALNGMYMVRPSQIEVDAWATMVGAEDAWGWDALYSAMKTSETFTPPSSQIQQEGDIIYQADSHGTHGPIQVSYPGFMLPVVGDWSNAFAALGVPTTDDAYGGTNAGSFIATSSINRPIGRGNLSANSVEYSFSKAGPRLTVNVTKEVILAGGTIGSPQVLMLSGVGPADVLQAAGVPVQVALPGVGQHLQDHLTAEVVWNTTDQTAASIYAANVSSMPTTTSSPFLSFVNSATGYVNFSTLLGANAQAESQSILSTIDSSASSLAIYNVSATQFVPGAVGVMEILLSLTGSGAGKQTIAIQAAMQHPFSQGRLYITSNDPFAYPAIDPNYLSHPSDLIMLREGLKLARQLGNTAPLSSAMSTEVSPGPSVSTDDDWNTWITNNAATEYHPSCSCAMLPQEQGGVVDTSLRVYGLSNVRVVDASVFPIQFSAHLQAPVYGLAEQASSLIRKQYNTVDSAPVSNSTSSSAPSGPSSSSVRTGGTGSWARRSHDGVLAVCVAALAMGVALAL
ncbi:GMC oxidoreductase [Amylocystis lapponica]|nr:GMC oxidoreductase [Amylocystis lapponica]